MYSLCYFEYPEQPDATEYGNTKRRHYFITCKYHFGDRANHDKAIETIEQRDEITLRSKLQFLRMNKRLTFTFFNLHFLKYVSFF